MAVATDFEASSFQKRPAYRYIRRTDKLPTTEQARAQGENAMVLVKLFGGPGTWYVTGYDADDRLATGYTVIDGVGSEMGDFSMEELVALRVPPFRMPIERDLYWTPKPLGAVVPGRD